VTTARYGEGAADDASTSAAGDSYWTFPRSSTHKGTFGRWPNRIAQVRRVDRLTPASDLDPPVRNLRKRIPIVSKAGRHEMQESRDGLSTRESYRAASYTVAKGHALQHARYDWQASRHGSRFTT